MIGLPKLIRKAPQFFYAAAIFAWTYRIVSNLTLIQTAQEFAGADADRTGLIELIVKSEPFASGFIDAAYMAANGVIIHVLIGIYDAVANASVKGVAE